MPNSTVQRWSLQYDVFVYDWGGEGEFSGCLTGHLLDDDE